MSAPTSIPEKLRDEVLRRSGEGQSTRAIAAWLKADHGGSGDHTQVSRFLKSARKGREEATRSIVHEHIGKTVPGDLDALDARIAGAVRVADRLQADMDKAIEADGDLDPSVLDLLIKASEMLRKLIDTKLKYSGAKDSGGNDIGELMALAFGPKIYMPAEVDE